MDRALIRCLLLSVSLAAAVGCNTQKFGVEDQSQNFAASVTYNNKVDVLLMVDNSSSMLQYQTKLALEVPGMIAQLESLGLDYHIAVVTSDMRSGGNGGRFLGGRYLTRSSSNLVSTLQSWVQTGQNGSDLERGLESIKTVLSPQYLSNEGAGFFRDDALLALVALTNEDDYSTDSIATLKNFFDRLKPPFKGTTKAWTMNFIGVVSIDGQCRTTADFKEAGLRWMELSDYTGGIKESICNSSLSRAVSNVRARIVEILSEYYLSRAPVVESIVVRINGRLINRDPVNGWSYSASKNSITFHGSSQPGALDQVSVDYTPQGGT